MGRTFDHDQTVREGNKLKVVLSFAPSAKYSKMRAFAIGETKRYLQFNETGFGKWVDMKEEEHIGEGKNHTHRMVYVSEFEEES